MNNNNFKMVLKNGEEVYFNIDKKIVGRTPTKTNLSRHSSDNSLYISTPTHLQI